MAIVEYRCRECGLEFEILSGREKLVCPACGSMDIERRWSVYSVRFRGSGFYETDYKKKERNE